MAIDRTAEDYVGIIKTKIKQYREQLERLKQRLEEYGPEIPEHLFGAYYMIQGNKGILEQVIKDLETIVKLNKFENTIEYEELGDARVKHVKSVNGFDIVDDKHAYQCQKCGAIYESKSKEERTVFPTDDPKCKTCDAAGHDNDDLVLICECEPLKFGY